ncbi:hypothetical protein AHF37_12784 [Paragonimus kellicotti]|nr:hypothetical protein AHF37_12784 [Paragonimus kellicotti]
MFDTITPRGSRVNSKQLQPQFFDKSVLGVPSSDRSSTTTSNVINGHNVQPGHPNDGNSKESADNATTTSDVIARVPICGIVAGGGASTIEHIYMSVTLNRCPMVIVRVSTTRTKRIYGYFNEVHNQSRRDKHLTVIRFTYANRVI